MFTVIAGLITQAISGATSWLKSKQEIKKAEAENRARLLRDEQTHNQNWEMASLTNAGWKDDVLFYAFLAMFVWAGFDPNGAKEFFENLNVLPEWFVKTWLWMVASILGVKKLGEYTPALIQGIKTAVKS